MDENCLFSWIVFNTVEKLMAVSEFMKDKEMAFSDSKS